MSADYRRPGRPRYTVWMVAALNVAMIVLAWFLLESGKSHSYDNAVTATDNIAESVALSVSLKMEKGFVGVRSVAKQVERALRRGAVDRAEVEKNIAETVQILSIFDAIRVTDKHGNVIYGAPPGFKANAADRDYFLALKNDPSLQYALSKPLIGRINNKWTIFLACRVNEPDGAFGGVAFGVIPVGNLTDLFSSFDLGEKGLVSLRGPDLGLLARLPEPGNLDAAIGKPAVSPQFREILDAGRTEASYIAKTGSDNVERVMSYRKVEPFGMHLVVGISTDKLLADVRDQTIAVLILLPVLAFLSLLFVLIDRASAARETAFERELAGTRERFLRLMEAASDGIWDWNAVSGEVYFSPNYYKMLGYAPDEFPASFGKWEELLHPDDHEKAVRTALELVEGKADRFEMEFRLREKGGGYRWILSRAKSVEKDGVGRALRILGTHVDINERMAAQQALRESEKRFRSLSENIPGVVYLCRNNERFTMSFLNNEVEKLTGYPREEFLSDRLSFVDLYHPDDAPGVFSQVEAALARKTPFHLVYRLRHREHGWRWVEEWGAGVFQGEELTFLEGFLADITERKEGEAEREKLAAQLLQSQKMESVGLLAGGIAHDFNNMLGVIIGHAELALELAPGPQLAEHIAQIDKAAHHSADITRQLLAFARKQTIAPKVVDLNDALAPMIKMIRRLIGEDIELAFTPAQNLWKVRIDPVQLDQIVANLATNARDAISSVGRVSVVTANVSPGAEFAEARPGFEPGDYVLLTFSDTGGGIEEEKLSTIFDPFFTTKELGKGTGLGLATVYGIVKQNGGFIDVESRPGAGTAFSIYLPRAEGEAVEDAPAPAPVKIQKGEETILIVEDEVVNLHLLKEFLSSLGYRALTAESPAQALALAEESGRVDLLLTDIVMPGMNGWQLSEELTRQNPALRTLFMSGYTSDVIAHKGVLDEGMNFIQKPYGLRELAAKIRQVLDA